MSSQFKVINQNNAGTDQKFGGDDLDKTHKWLNGQSGYTPVTLHSAFGVEDGKFFIEYPVTGKRVYIRTGSLAADMDWWLPIGTGWIDNTLKNRFVNEQIFQKWISFKKITPPENPDVDHLTLWADSSSGQIMVKDSSGVAQAIFADIATIANMGTTGIGVYDSKVSSTVYLRSITSLHNALVASLNNTTHSIDLDIDPSQILLEELGGTLLSSQVPTLGTGNLPSSVVLDNENTTLTGLIKLDKQIEMKLQTTHPTPSAGYVSFYCYEGKLYFKNSSGTLMNILYNTDLDNTVPLPPAGYVSGHWDGTGIQGTGLLNNMVRHWDSTNEVADYHDITTGKYGQEWKTEDDGEAIGLTTVKANTLYRDANPTITIGFQVDCSAGVSSTQYFLGVSDQLSESVWDDADPLSASGADGFMLCKRMSDTAWQIGRNDGSGTAVYDNNSLPTVDTGYHTVVIKGDNDNDRWGLSWDGGAFIWKTDEDPIEERDLGIMCMMNMTGTGLRYMRLFDITVTRKHF